MTTEPSCFTAANAYRSCRPRERHHQPARTSRSSELPPRPAAHHVTTEPSCLTAAKARPFWVRVYPWKVHHQHGDDVAVCEIGGRRDQEVRHAVARRRQQNTPRRGDCNLTTCSVHQFASPCCQHPGRSLRRPPDRWRAALLQWAWFTRKATH